MPSKWDDNEEIQIFREYLRIPSVHPDIDYGKLCFIYGLLLYELQICG